jgi:hypothetical protein
VDGRKCLIVRTSDRRNAVAKLRTSLLEYSQSVARCLVARLVIGTPVFGTPVFGTTVIITGASSNSAPTILIAGASSNIAWTATVLVAGSPANIASATATAVAVVLSPQGSKPLLLGVRVDVCADDEADDVEEGHPCGFWKELLGEGQRDGRDNPADLHDGPETSPDGRADLVDCPGTRNERHGH